jgi:hypothetical protein
MKQYYNRQPPHASLGYQVSLVAAYERCVMNNVLELNKNSLALELVSRS